MKTGYYVITLLMLGSAVQAQVHIDMDKNVDFTKYKTFKFESGKIVRSLGVVDTTKTFFDQNVKDAIVTSLSKKGMTVSDTNPDLIFTYLAGAKEKQEIENYMTNGFYYPYYRFYALSGWWGPQWNNYWVRNYEEGTLIIDAIDSKTDHLVWRAYASSAINNYNEEKFVSEEVPKAFKHFPPIKK